MKSPCLHPLALAVASLFACHAGAQAVDPPAGAASAPQASQRVQVTATRDKESATAPVAGYAARNGASATKTDTPLRETPQAVTVVTRDQMVDQGAQNVQDALNYAAGVRSDAYGLDSRSDSVRVRGSYPDEYLDGLRQLFNWYTSTTRVDPYTLERIEVLRGPAAMLYGQGSTAGVVNLVSKRPQAQAQGEVGVQIGSFGRRQLQADVTGPLSADGQWLYRLVALGRDADTQVDFVRDDRALVAPSLTWRPSAQTSLTLQALWQRDRSGSTAQFLPWEGNVLPNPNGRIASNRFVGEPGFDRYDSERSTVGWLFEHRLDERWALRQNVRFTRNEVDYRSIYADSFSSPGDAYIDAERRTINRIAWWTQPKVNMVTTDQHAEGKVDFGGAEHRLLIGLDALRFRQTERSVESMPLPLDVYGPVYTGFTPGELAARPKQGQRQFGLYLQDQMKFGERWIVVAGLRHDRATSSLEGEADNKTSATTKRLGAMFLADGGWSPYVSYSESFTPVAGTDAQGARYKPLRGKQVEAGVKFEPAGQRTSFTAAVYSLREENQSVSDPANPLFNVQVGETKTRGVELEAKAELARTVDLVAHYNYTDIDEKLEALPKHQAAVWTKWRLAALGAPALSLGAGVRWLDEFKDGAAPATPSVTLLDLMLAWDTPRWRYALNVNNATDKYYVSTCLSRGDCFVGARRNVVASATYRW